MISDEEYLKKRKTITDVAFGEHNHVRYGRWETKEETNRRIMFEHYLRTCAESETKRKQEKEYRDTINGTQYVIVPLILSLVIAFNTIDQAERTFKDANGLFLFILIFALSYILYLIALSLLKCLIKKCIAVGKKTYENMPNKMKTKAMAKHMKYKASNSIQRFISLDGKKLLIIGAVITVLIIFFLWLFPIPRYTMQTVSSGISHKLDRWTGNVYIVTPSGERLLENEQTKKQKVHSLEKEEIQKIDGRAGPDDTPPYFTGTFYNGNHNIVITEVTCKIVSYEACEEWKSSLHDDDCDDCLMIEKYRQNCVFTFSHPLKPYETSEATQKVLWHQLFEYETIWNGKCQLKNRFRWKIIGAKGYKLK